MAAHAEGLVRVRLSSWLVSPGSWLLLGACNVLIFSAVHGKENVALAGCRLHQRCLPHFGAHACCAIAAQLAAAAVSAPFLDAGIGFASAVPFTPAQRLQEHQLPLKMCKAFGHENGKDPMCPCGAMQTGQWACLRA